MSKKIKIQIHPRAFSAFGEDLVTNDLVAMTELIKNSYDAFATTVRITFGTDENNTQFIKIEDDGSGMTAEVVQSAWATVATPYKKNNPCISRIIDGDNRIRVVSGNKGLGRFSAARLGDKLEMVTKYKEAPCLKVGFDWRSLLRADSIADCFMDSSELKAFDFVENSTTGTTIIIKDIKSEWNQEKIETLVSDLSRLINPFEAVSDFKIFVLSDFFNEIIKVKAQEFINSPIYKIKGKVAANGNIIWDYVFDNGRASRKKTGLLAWNEENYKSLSEFKAGRFSFEVRGWDLDSDSIADVSQRFDIKKSEIRSNIRVYKGLSIYRDKVLVLPKSESSRDWLGLDAKRISQVGRKIATSQIVGIINITSGENPGIKDTTDREKLVDNLEYSQFVQIVYSVVNVLENERLKDKSPSKKSNLSDIMAPLSSKTLVSEVEKSVESGSSSTDILQLVKNYDLENEKSLANLNERLIYYAQTASLGSVAMIIMHEFLTGMTIIKRFLNKSKNYLGCFDDRTKEYLMDANDGHRRIMEVAQSFAPLHRKDLRNVKTVAYLPDAIEKSIRLIKGKKISKDIVFTGDFLEDLNVRISESELQTIFVNLLDNACYWIKDANSDTKEINISVHSDVVEGRVIVTVSDSGLGVSKEDVEKIFMPGVTAKPSGIGMGLVIVSELLSYYDNKIGVQIPGCLGGASFVFDLKLVK